MATTRLGIMGIAHVHIGSLLKQAAAVEGVELVGIADPTRADICERLAGDNGIAAVYPDYAALLDGAAPDGVICCAENSRHVDVVEAAAAAGVPVMLEKPMAGRLDHALRIADLARASGIGVMTNWPFLWSATFHRLAALVAAGELGRVFEFRLRAGHGGPTGGSMPEDRRAGWWFFDELGGGALLDFCCYGACESLILIGEDAQYAVALADRLCYDFGDTEDNAVMLVRFPSAFAILEATWTQHGDPGPHLTVWGTKATAYLGEGKIIVLRDGQREEVEPGEQPLEASGPAHFVNCIRTGKPFHPVTGVEHNLKVMGILEAGRESARARRAVDC
jgi:predicted dehydrogenase